MSKVIINKTKLDALAASVAEKSGENLPMSIDKMRTTVENLETGGGAETFEVHIGDCLGDDYHYGITPFSDILDAVRAGKVIIATVDVTQDEEPPILYSYPINYMGAACLDDSDSINVFLFDDKVTGNIICYYIEDGDTVAEDVFYKNYYEYATPNDFVYPSAFCKSSGADQYKYAVCTNWVATAKTYIHVVMSNANSRNGAIYLDIGSTGNKRIYINGEPSSSTNKTLPAGSYIVYYDGTYYHFRTDGLIPMYCSSPRHFLASSSDSGFAEFRGLDVADIPDLSAYYSTSLPFNFTVTENSGTYSVSLGDKTWDDFQLALYNNVYASGNGAGIIIPVGYYNDGTNDWICLLKYSFNNNISKIVLTGNDFPFKIVAQYSNNAWTATVTESEVLKSDTYTPPVSSVNGQTGAVTLSIPTVPTTVSSFTNDAGYITLSDIPAANGEGF